MKNKTLETFLTEYDNYDYTEIENLFSEYLDEVYESVELAGMTINASDMESIDPVMFRCGVSDWSSEEFEEHEGVYYRTEDFNNANDEYEEYELEKENKS